MTPGATFLWRFLPVAGLILLAAATYASHHVPPAQLPSDEIAILEIGAPVVTLLFPPPPFPPSMGTESLLTAALAAAGWSALALSLPPLLLRAPFGRLSRLFALPGAVFALFTLFCFLYAPQGGLSEAPQVDPQPLGAQAAAARNSLLDLLSQLYALNVILILASAAIAVIAFPLRLMRRD